MKQVQKILNRRPVVLGLLALLPLVGAFLFRNTASAHPSSPQSSSPLTPGTYTGTNTFMTGPMAGQSEPVTLTFNSDGTMSSDAPLSGQGYWWVVSVMGNAEVNVAFRVILPPGAIPGATDVQVIHSITDFQKNGTVLTSQGRSLVYNSGTPLAIAQSTAQVTLQ